MFFIYVSDPCKHDGTGESIDGTGAKAVAAYIDISDDYITEPEKAWRAGGLGCQQDSRFQIGPPRIWFVAFCSLSTNIN